MARKPEYGRGPQAFLEYVHFIVEHPNYAGMPDVYMDNGGHSMGSPVEPKIRQAQGHASSAADWWREKAVAVGIDPNSLHWISRTVKFIPPHKEEAMQELWSGHGYSIHISPPRHFVAVSTGSISLMRAFQLTRWSMSPASLRAWSNNSEIVYSNTYQRCSGHRQYRCRPFHPDLQAWLTWIEEKYVPQEPMTLSPGAMSNAPDRLDGFHSFNYGCRSKTDPGRSLSNLQSYTTDRRVFEYWVEGDWVAADRLMGLIRSDKRLKEEVCVNGHAGPCAADHIGPISLGFVHRPEFQLLCRMCNSAKNNRMSVRDIQHLIAAENRGEQVASWYCSTLWNLRKMSVLMKKQRSD